MLSKSEIRSGLLRRRDAMEGAEARHLSRLIQKAVLASNLLRPVKAMGLYHPFRNEVDTSELFSFASGLEITVAYPLVQGDRLEFFKTETLQDKKKGRWGLEEPVGGEPVSVSDLEVIFVPGVAFDELGGRIGFGKGFYDHTLCSFEGLKVGLCYDYQLLPKLPSDRHDVGCDLIVTENRRIAVMDKSLIREASLWNRK